MALANDKTFGWGAAEDKLVQPHMEYLRKNRWVMDFAGLPAGLANASADAAVALRLNCSKAARPKISFEEAEVKRLNGSIYLAGKPKYEPLQITFYDSLRQPDPLQDMSTASEIIEQWRELIYQPNKGDAFGSVANYKGFAYLHMLAPVTLEANVEGPQDFTVTDIGSEDSIAQSWLYQGLFPQNIDYGEVDYGANDVQEITVTFRYDRALRIAKKPSLSA